MNISYDGFISYGRADSKAFVTMLHERLKEKGLNVWFDQNDIPLGVDFQNQIDDGIEKADNFLYIIAPHSINSPYCGKEIDLAIKRNKRIIPCLHVEQISYETWQKRNPNGTPEQWETYKSKGLHSSFPNMHPVIGKINWIYFREGVDDFETSFAGLLALVDRHREYVQQHTYFLSRALEWERNQKLPQYLLIGDDRQKGENWLRERFRNEQPPCEPTDLHCEYICESIQNANSMMTDAFLSHSETDRQITDKIRASLMRQSFTVWVNKTDIKTGTEFQEEINHGIEATDNLIFLISSSSLKSVYCQQELTYAFELKKRIIPLLIESIDLNEIPVELRSLQFIDFTIHADAEKYQTSVDKLINALYDEAPYYEQHKILLTRALKWERQKRNTSILLRGHTLRQAEAWLKVAQVRPQHSSTPLQEELVRVSLEQPPDAVLDVFISYSRADSDFTRRLNDALQLQGKTTWFDQESIASGTDFQQEVFQGIETCNNFLFIISPHSINSPYCANEVEYAKRLNKRLITVLHRPVNEADLHPVLASVQWIDFNRENKDFLANFGEVIRTLDTDLDYTRSHTRLLVKGREWERSGKDPSYLLRGKDLKESEQWLKASATKPIPANDLQKNYIITSRKAPYLKPKPRTAALTGLGVGLAIIIVRFLGLMVPLELAIYDRMMRAKPVEPLDDRFLVVGIEESDILGQIKQFRTRGWGTIPDQTVEKVIGILQAAKPRVIGLDMDRDYQTENPAMAERIQKDANLVLVCRQPYSEEIPGTSPPPELPEDLYGERIGFSDLVVDTDLVIRRHLVMNGAADLCPVESSFSLALARKYLETEGKTFQPPYTPDGEYIGLELGEQYFQDLFGSAASGYQQTVFGGYQILLNYRRPAGDDRSAFVERVTMQDVLDGKVPADKIRDRVILIGITSRQTVRDYSLTPYGEEMGGVLIQAQQVSQLISAVLDQRPLLWWLPAWGDWLIILGGALAGGVIVWLVQRPLQLIVLGFGSSLVLIVICYNIFSYQGGWIPLAPPLMAMVLTGAGTIFITQQFRK